MRSYEKAESARPGSQKISESGDSEDSLRSKAGEEGNEETLEGPCREEG